MELYFCMSNFAYVEKKMFKKTEIEICISRLQMFISSVQISIYIGPTWSSNFGELYINWFLFNSDLPRAYILYESKPSVPLKMGQ